MSKAFVRTLLGLMASAALAAPAMAADSFFATADVQDFDHGCGDFGGGGGASTSPIGAGFACGSGQASAISTPGHLGAAAHVSGNSIVDATADYTTFVTFRPTNGQTGDIIPIQLNTAINGEMGVAGSAVAGYNVIVDIEHVDFSRSTSIDSSADPSHGVINLGFSQGGEVDNKLSAFIGGVLTTGTVMAGVGVPVGVSLHLHVQGFGNPGSMNDQFLNSLDFVRGQDVFNLPDGFTADDPDAFIFNNRYLPPAVAGGAPEPAGWALLIAGFGLAGAGLRRRRAQAA